MIGQRDYVLALDGGYELIRQMLVYLVVFLICLVFYLMYLDDLVDKIIR